MVSKAGQAATSLWEQCEDQQVVEWVDNFYRRRHGTDPQVDDLSLNISVMTLMTVPINLRPFPGHPPLREVVDSIDSLAATLAGMKAEVMKGIACVTDEPMQAAWIRVPLDIQRESFVFSSFN